MLVNTGCGSTFYRKKTGFSRPRSCGGGKFSHPSLDRGTYREAGEDRDFHSPTDIYSVMNFHSPTDIYSAMYFHYGVYSKKVSCFVKNEKNTN